MEHDAIPAGEIHAPHNWVVADEAARLALVVTEADLGKYCWQRDNESQWFLSAHDPATWHPMATTVAWGDIADKPDLIEEGDSRLTDSRTPTGGAGGVLSGSFPNPGFAVDMATQGEVDTQVTLLYTALDDLDSAKVDVVPGKGLSTEDYTTAEKTKLAGIATGATANSTDAALRDRASHTGEQDIDTVTGLQAALDGKQPAGSYETAGAAAAALAELASTASGKGAALVSFIAAGTGAAVRSALEKMRDVVSVVDYGAVADDTTDCSTAFTNARIAAVLKGHKRIYVPGAATNYRLVSTFTIDTSGTLFYGDGPHSTKIRTESTGAGISVNTGLIGVSLEGFMLHRTAGTAGAGKHGIVFVTTTEQATIRNVYLTRHQIGLNLGGTNYSYCEELILDANYSHGVFIGTNATNNTAQWTFHKCLAQRNDGYGLLLNTASGTAQTSVGDISLFSTYANKLGGVLFEGKSGAPIQGVRWFGGFVGEDGGHGLWLNTYNTVEHKIEGIFAEIAGTAACGVDGATPAPMVGNGIRVEVNNGPVTIQNAVVVSNAYSGIQIGASRGKIVGCTLRANGIAGVSGERNGIRIIAGQTSVVGCNSKGHTNYGVYSDVDSVHVVANDLRENGTAGYGQTPAIVTSVVIGNMGDTTNNFTGPIMRDGVQVLNTRRTGWAAMTGTATRTTIATGSATTAQVAERLKALIDDLIAHGIIGT